MKEKEREALRRMDLSQFIAESKDKRDPAVYNNTGVEDESDTDDNNGVNELLDTPPAARTRRTVKPPQRFQEGQKQAKLADKREKEERAWTQKESTSAFTNYFYVDGCKDFSFLNKSSGLSPQEKASKEKVYAYFNIRSTTSSSCFLPHECVATDFDLYITLLFWKYCIGLKASKRGIPDATEETVTQFCTCVKNLEEGTECCPDKVKEYIKKSIHVIILLVVVKLVDAARDHVFQNGDEGEFYREDSVLNKAAPSVSQARELKCKTASESGMSKQAVSKIRQKERCFIQEKYPSYECVACKDRFVIYTLHFDGVCTSFWGSGKTYEVVSLQILNTNENSRKDRRFCCFLGIIPHIKNVTTAAQDSLSFLRTIIQEMVVSGILGRYYYSNGIYYHIRWCVLALCGDTKAQEVLSGFPGKQLSNHPSLYDDTMKVYINPITKRYDVAGDYLTTVGSGLSFAESPWNKLNSRCYYRFWNVVNLKKSKLLQQLEKSADEDGKKEINHLKRIRQVFGSDNGWRPVPFPRELSTRLWCNSVTKAIEWNKTETTCRFPDFSAVAPTTAAVEETDDQQDGEIECLQDYILQRASEEAGATEASRPVSDCGSQASESALDDAEATQKMLLNYYQNKLKSGEKPSQYRGLDSYLPLPPGFAFVVDPMHLVGNAVTKFMVLLSNKATKTTTALKGLGIDVFASKMRDSKPSDFSCLTVDKCYLAGAIKTMKDYVTEYPGNLDWFQPGMLLHENMTDLKTEYKFQVAFGIAHFAFKDFRNESPILEMLTCFDAMAYLVTAFTCINEVCAVQGRLDFFLGKLCNMMYPGFENPTITNLTAIAESILRCGCLVAVSSFPSEGSYHYVIDNMLSGRSPQKTVFDRIHLLMVSNMFLFWSRAAESDSFSNAEYYNNTSNPLLDSIPSWIADEKIAFYNFQDDLNYVRDDSKVYDDLFFKMVNTNGLMSEELSDRNRAPCPSTLQQMGLLSHFTWNGVVYHSACEPFCGKRERPALHQITPSTLMTAKDSLAITLNKDGSMLLLLIVGYYVTFIDGNPYPEAVGIVIPTYHFSLVAPWCPYCYLDIQKIQSRDWVFRYVRTSLNRIHVNSATPLPYNNGNVMIFSGCLVLRAERVIIHSPLFRPSQNPVKNLLRKRGRKATDVDVSKMSEADIIRLFNENKRMKEEIEELKKELQMGNEE